MKAILVAAKDNSVEVSEPHGWLLCCYSPTLVTSSHYFQVWAEDADVLIMLIHYSICTNHPLFFSKGSYNVKRIQKSLSKGQRCYLPFCHAFTGCDTVPTIAGHGKTTLFNRFCARDIDEHIDIFLDVQANKDAAIRSGISIYHAPGTVLISI